MQVQRDFQPTTYIELVQDYAYLIYDDNVDDQLRKVLKMDLFKEAVPRIWLNDLPLFREECATATPRSIFVIYRQDITRLDPGECRELLQFDVKYLSDNEMLDVMKKISQQFRAILSSIKTCNGDTYRRAYEQRQRQLQYITSLSYYEIFMLHNYKYNEGCSQIVQNVAANMIESLRLRLDEYANKPIPVESSKVFVRLQDFNRRFIKRDLESLELKSAVPPAQCLTAVTDQLLYALIQPSFPLCDNPTLPAFYLNDTREQHLQGKRLESTPAGRLMIRGNSVQYPSCILQDQQAIKVSDELATRYQKYEYMMQKSVSFLALSLTTRIARAKNVYQDILTEIQTLLEEKDAEQSHDDKSPNLYDKIVNRISSNINSRIMLEQQLQTLLAKKGQNYGPQWHMSNLLDLDEIASIWCYEIGDKEVYKLFKSENIEIVEENSNLLNQQQDESQPEYQTNGSSKLYQSQIQKLIKGTYHDMFSDYSVESTGLGDPIKVPIQQPRYYIYPEVRNRTTYETLQMLTIMFQCIISTTKGQLNSQQFLKRPYNFHKYFSEFMTLKDVFVPLGRLDRLLAAKVKCKEPNELLSLYRQNIKQYKDHIGSQNQLVEDTSAGECIVCSCQYDNYKSHINSPTHIRLIRGLMTSGDNLQESLKAQASKLQDKQAIQASLSQLTSKLALKFNITYKKAAIAINESIRAVNFNQQVDENDIPRSNSPTTKIMNNWIEHIQKQRMDYMETCFCKQEVRKNASWRIKQTAPLLALLSKNYINNQNNLLLKNLVNKIMSVFGSNQSSAYKNNQYIIDDFEDDKNSEEGYVMLQMQPELLYNFNQEEYEILQQIAMIIVLLRYCQQQSILQEHSQEPNFLDHKNPNKCQQYYTQGVNTIRKRLAWQYPCISAEPYDKALQQLEEGYKQYNINKSIAQSNIMSRIDDNDNKHVYLHQKYLREELADIEIGLLPRTDQLINIYMTIFEIKQPEELLQQALQCYERRLLNIIEPQMIYHIMQYLQNGKVFVYNNEQIFNDNVMQRVQLPQIYPIKNEIEQCITDELNEASNNDHTNNSSSKQQQDCNYVYSASDEQRIKDMQLQAKDYTDKPYIEYTAKHTEQSQSYSYYYNQLQYQQQFSMHSPLHLTQTLQQIFQISKPQYKRIFQLILSNLNIAISSNPTDSTLIQEIIFDSYYKHEPEESTQGKQEVKIYNQLNTLIQVSFHQGGYTAEARSRSCTTFNQQHRIKTINNKRIKQKVRSNSITNLQTMQLDENQVSIVMLGSEQNDEPIITNKILIDNQSNNEEALQENQLSGGFFAKNKRIYAKYQNAIPEPDQLVQNQQQVNSKECKLIWRNKHTIVSPLLSGNQHFTVKESKHQFINLQNQQICAIYSALLSYFGFEYNTVSCNLQDIIPDVCIASSGTINTIENMRQHRYLNTLDIMSIIIVMLSAENKIMTNSLQKHISSKTIQRSIPCDLITQEEVDRIMTIEDKDCHVVHNTGNASKELFDDIWFTNYSKLQEHQ